MNDREIELLDTLYWYNSEKDSRSFKMFPENINFSYDTRPQEFVDRNFITSDEKEHFKTLMQNYDINGRQSLLSEVMLKYRFCDNVTKQVVSDDTSYNQAIESITNANAVTDANMISYSMNKISIMWFIHFTDILKQNGA